MKTKTRTTLVLALTFLIGIVLGVIGGNILRSNRYKARLEGFRNPERFIERVEKSVNPKPEQKEKLRQILINQHNKMVEMGDSFRGQMRAQADSMKAELDSLLTPEQMQKLERMFHMRKSDRHHPGRSENQPR